MTHLDPDQWPNLSRRLAAMHRQKERDRNRREYHRDYMRRYIQRPEVKAKRAELSRRHASKPEVKFRRKMREAGFTPEQIAAELERGGFA